MTKGAAVNSVAMSGDWDRSRLVAFADRLIDGGRAHLSPNGSQILYPGAEGGYGRAVDGLEGFTRTLLVAGFRIAGERGVGVDELIEFCVRGVTAGVDPEGADRWVRLTEHAQAKVEAASIALILDMTRPWVWDRLDAVTQQRAIEYFSPVVGDDTYPTNNWLWFRIVVQTFLRSVGGPWSLADIEADLALHEELQRGNGWMSDGHERSFDHYVGWALHLYPILWSRMSGADELVRGRSESDIGSLDRFLQDAVTLVGADGSPLIQGRSLIYRFAAAAPYWAGIIANVPSTSPGVLRAAATRIVAHFDEHGAPNEQGVLTMGWHDEWRALAQSYSGPGSPYWAVKGLLGVAIPADHPVWSSPTEPLPIDSSDQVRAIVAPGWLVSGTQSDGIVRIINHGTDHGVPEVLAGDSPLYARLGYSTATSPMLDEESWMGPLDQSVVLRDERGRSTHRTGLVVDSITVDDGIGVAGSGWQAHWLEATPPERRHGSGLPGTSIAAGWIDVRSLTHGPWEVRLVCVDSIEPGQNVTGLRIGGWAVAGDGPIVDASTATGTATATASGLRTAMQLLVGEATPHVETRSDASPLGAVSAVPYLDFDAVPHGWVAALVTLESADAADATDAAATIETADGILTVSVTWPDGRRTSTRLPEPRSAVAAGRHQDRAQ
jgi:hypothetical protein